MDCGEDTTRRFTENGVTITAVMWLYADTDHTRHAVATDTTGRFIGAYHPTDLIRQTGWLVVTADTPTPTPVPSEPHAVMHLITHGRDA